MLPGSLLLAMGLGLPLWDKGVEDGRLDRDKANLGYLPLLHCAEPKMDEN